MAYAISVDDVNLISEIEAAFSTTRLLPLPSDIPREFYTGNIYSKTVEAIFYGKEIPAADIELAEGLEPSQLNKCVRAHLYSFDPKHEDKIAGVAFMISKVSVITPAEVT